MTATNPLDLARHLHYEHIPHPHVAARHAEGPVKVADQHRTDNAVTRFNTQAALLITKAVGSMWCAYLFAAFDLISLPAAIRGGASTIVAWVAQTFLQLVLLSVIMVGQNVQADAADARSEATYHDASATLHETAQLQEHLAAQDALLTRIAAHLGLNPVPVIDIAGMEARAVVVGEVADVEGEGSGAGGGSGAGAGEGCGTHLTSAAD
ncbi:hypothetical protein Caci_1911 [Catenulispora acidiphila DSM 44928]|uniref:DUF1003 domain-containing protein n=1 Tax=Catenulispora acidiphila (strain DSM 44928 / JCM 14897 / NBRC 102108 / NRRL B-24433 / ID139908) TaxID=479433 RepID=C7QEE0_CATAD|nr:DUF1003 domain-containing protein [Catenulispora acidiphila]ACU70831.1 hypothetical protein Caci_1911 [Catenulispora acidiphila DSM 44928]